MQKEWQTEITQYQKLVTDLLKEAQALGVTQAEVHCSRHIGFSTTVRDQAVETLEYQKEHALSVTVYMKYQKGEASTTDFKTSSLSKTLKAAYRIAKLAQPDECFGLADLQDMSFKYPELSLYHPWEIDSLEAIELAKQVEAKVLTIDPKISNSDGVNLSTGETLMLYGNTHGFLGHYLSSHHYMDCTVIAKDNSQEMQCDGKSTISRDPAQLKSIDWLAEESAKKVLARLGARQIKTCQAPVIFEASVARTLIGYFLKAISGAALYQQSSFLLNQKGQPIFPTYINIVEDPFQLKGLGSAPFDAEGVAPQKRNLIEAGVLKSYLLGSYSARRLGLQTTGNSGGCYNILVDAQEPNLEALLAKMEKGLLVTEVIGHGVNLVTGDYSQGVAGFWVENGRIQYPVQEITVAGNLRDMYQQIVAIAGDVGSNSKIQTGSILIERMTIGGS